MTNVTRPEPWLSLCLLLVLAGNSPSETPQSEKAPDKPKVKLPALLAAKPLKAGPQDDELRKLLKARYNEAVSEARDYYELEHLASTSAIEMDANEGYRYQALHRVMQAGLEVFEKPAEKVAFLKQYLEVLKAAEKRTQAKNDVGRNRLGDLNRARYERLDAEIRLLRAKREADKAKDK